LRALYRIFLLAAVSVGTEPATAAEEPVAHSTICPSTPIPIAAANFVAKVKRSALLNESKDEFETTSQHDDRLSRLAKAEFGDTMSVATVLPSYVIKYDADTGILTIDVARSDIYARRSDLLVTEIQSISRTTGFYDAQNAYGVSFEVEKQSITEFVIAWGDGPAPISGVKAWVKVPAEEARALKAHAELVVAGRLRNPFLERRFDLRAATMDSPTRREIESYAMFLTPSCLYLRNVNGKPYGLQIGK